MAHPDFFILYVDHPPRSATFYADLFGTAPVECSPTFALFVLDSGVKFGLWSKHTVEPATTLIGGGGEVAFSVADRGTVDALYAEWTQRGLRVAQVPVEMDFGYTFVVLDPDGHRLRVFVSSGT